MAPFPNQIIKASSSQDANPDRLMAWILCATVPLVVLLAAITAGDVVSTAYCTQGAVSPELVITGHWTTALIISSLVSLGSYLLMRSRPGSLVTRLYNGFAVMAMAALFMHFGGGYGEAHFPFFVLLSFLVYYRDWRPIAFACVVITVHHLGFYALESAGWPVIVFSCLDMQVLAIHLAAGASQGLVLGYIAERMRKADTLLRMQAEDLRMLSIAIEQNTSAVFITNTKGIIEYANPQFYELTGYTEAETIGQTPSILKSDNNAPGLYEAMWQALEEGLVWRGELINRRKNGDPFWCVEHLSPLEATNGRITHYLATLDNINDRKRAESQLEQYQHHLESLIAERTADLVSAKDNAERANAAKSEFLSRMSHELRTPLNVIIGFAQMLGMPSKTPLTEQQADNVQEILKAGQHLLTQVNEVLDLARIETGRIELSLEPLPLAPLVADCMAQLQPLAAMRGIRTVSTVLETQALKGDYSRIKQVFLNLISNAIKYNRENGQIQISAQAKGDLLRVEVSDTGRGIDPDKLGRLFTPFERLESSYDGIEGTGIGLALVKRLVEAMGGQVGVFSKLAVGSTFWFELPAAYLPELSVAGEPSKANQHIESPTQDQPGAMMAAKPSAVLYIEDNPANLKLMRKIISSHPNLVLLEAADAEAGIELARTVIPRLILLDINLPGMDGFAAIAQLKEWPETAHIPVIAVTANAMNRDVERGKTAGFTDYLTKPLDVPYFLGLLDRLLDEKSVTRGAGR